MRAGRGPTFGRNDQDGREQGPGDHAGGYIRGLPPNVFPPRQGVPRVIYARAKQGLWLQIAPFHVFRPAAARSPYPRRSPSRAIKGSGNPLYSCLLGEASFPPVHLNLFRLAAPSVMPLLTQSSEMDQGCDPTFFGSRGWYLPVRTASALAEKDLTALGLATYLNDNVVYLQSLVEKRASLETLEVECGILCHRLVNTMLEPASLFPWARGRSPELLFSAPPDMGMLERDPAALSWYRPEHFRRFYYDLVMSSGSTQRHKDCGTSHAPAWLRALFGDSVGVHKGRNLTQLSSQMLDLCQIEAVASLVNIHTLAVVASLLQAWDALGVLQAMISHLLPRALRLLRTGNTGDEVCCALDDDDSELLLV